MMPSRPDRLADSSDRDSCICGGVFQMIKKLFYHFCLPPGHQHMECANKKEIEKEREVKKQTLVRHVWVQSGKKNSLRTCKGCLKCLVHHHVSETYCSIIFRIIFTTYSRGLLMAIVTTLGYHSEGHEFKSQYCQAATVGSQAKSLTFCVNVSCFTCKSLWMKANE